MNPRESQHVGFRLLGSLEVTSDDTGPVDLGGLKQRAVLALLVVNVGRVVSLDRFVSELWDEEPPAHATASLQAYVSRLRRLLEPGRDPRQPSRLLPTRPPGWLLAADPETVDAVRFARLAAEGRQLLASDDPGAARQALSEALMLWRSPALAEFLPAPFARAEGTRLEELRLSAVEDRLDAELALGLAATVAAEIEGILAEHPYRERLWGQLMLALYRCGRQGDALAAYRRARERLEADLGIDPGPGLRQLEQQILRQSADLLKPAGPLRAAPARHAVAVGPRGTSLPPPDGPLLAGREDVLERLDATLAAARRSSGRVVLIRGGAGIGKSALLRELARRSAAAGVAVAAGSCVESDTPPVFWPWLQLLRGLTEAADPDEVAAAFKPHGNVLALLDPSLGERVPLPPPEPAADPELGRTRLLHALSAGLATFASQRPAVLLVDDLQWADGASLQVFALLAQRLAAAPIALVAAYRDDDTDWPAPFSQALGQLAATPGAEQLKLQGLSADAVAACVQAISERMVAPEVTTVLHERTAGNPFFLGELVRMLLAERALDDVTVAARRLPERVQEVVSRRVARLPEQTRAVLAVAAVAGQQVPLDLLERTIQVDQPLLFDMVESAIVSGMLAEEPSPGGLRLRFTHDLVRQTIYERLSSLRQAQLHAQIAGTLQASGDADPLEIARHARLGVPVTGPGAAVPLVLRAAGWARGRLAFEQEIQLLRAAAELAEAMPAGADRDHHELQARIRLGFVYQMLHGYAASQARQQMEAAAALLRRLPPDRSVLPALWHCAGAYWINAQFAAALNLAETVAARAPDDEPAVRVATETIRGAVAWFTGRVTEARTRMEAVAELIAGADPAAMTGFDFDPEIRARIFAAAACQMLGDTASTDAHLDAASARAQLIDDEFTSLYVLHQHAWVAVVRGDPARAAPAAQAELDLATRRGYLEFTGKGRIFTAWAQAHLGDSAGAAEVSAAIADLPRYGMPVLRHFWYRLEAEAKLATGDAAGALAAASQGLACSARTGECWSAPDLHVLQAVALSRLGRAAEATQAARTGLSLARASCQRPAERKAQAALGRLALTTSS